MSTVPVKNITWNSGVVKRLLHAIMDTEGSFECKEVEGVSVTFLQFYATSYGFLQLE